MRDKTNFLTEEYLIQDYEYANNYSLDILKDRALSFNLSAAILGAVSYTFIQIFTAQKLAIDKNLLIASLLSLFFLLNGFYFFHFVALKENYRDSVSRMQEIRDYYVKLTSDDALREILLAKKREFLVPTKLRPTNLAACIWFTVFELASLIVAGVFFDKYLNWYPRLVIVAAVVAATLAVIQIYFYRKPFLR